MVEEFDDDEGLDLEEESTETTPGKSKTGMMFILIIGVLIVIVGAIAAFFIIRNTASGSGSKPANTTEEVVAAAENIPEPQGKPILYEVGDIYVNIRDTRSTRVLKFTPFLEVNEPRMNEALDDFGPLLKDRIATVARKMTFDELEGPNGPEVLKQEIRDTLNRSLKNRLNGVIIAVHFDDFLIQ
jgi:flagellar basal body-associated protein FliL